MGQHREYMSRILAVGSPASDGIHRLTQGNTYVCCEGTDEEHEVLHRFCQNVEALLNASGLELQDLTPDEFACWVKTFMDHEKAE